METGKKRETCDFSLVREGKYKLANVAVFIANKESFISTVSNHFCRTIAREHIPKKHLDFENPIQTDKVFDNTANRVYGEAR